MTDSKKEISFGDFEIRSCRSGVVTDFCKEKYGGEK